MAVLSLSPFTAIVDKTSMMRITTPCDEDHGAANYAGSILSIGKEKHASSFAEVGEEVYFDVEILITVPTTGAQNHRVKVRYEATT
jgi:hypothetical protein